MNFSNYSKGIYKITGIDTSKLDLDKTLDCGQCFRWNKLQDGTWFGVVKSLPVMIKEKLFDDNTSGYITTATEKEFETLLIDYFSLNINYDEHLDIEDLDEFAHKAAIFGRGIRILNQEPWEALISFIISQRNNIPKIKSTIARLCEAHGEPLSLTVNNKTYNTYKFPTSKKILEAGIEGLQGLGLGYRDEYVLYAAKAVDSDEIDLQKLCDKNISGYEAVDKLKELYGVGDKVANCVALFGLNKLDMFPIDVWMQRIINNYYNGELNPSKYGCLAGLVQQYMFYYIKSIS